MGCGCGVSIKVPQCAACARLHDAQRDITDVFQNAAVKNFSLVIRAIPDCEVIVTCKAFEGLIGTILNSCYSWVLICNYKKIPAHVCKCLHSSILMSKPPFHRVPL